MSNYLIDSIVNKLIDYNIANLSNIEPCSYEEIEKLEFFIGSSLPGLYKNFLYKMGKKAGFLFYDCTCFYDDLFDLHNEKDFYYNKIIEASLTLPNNFFVFYDYTADEFCLFDLDDKSFNPNVYLYLPRFPDGKYIKAEQTLYDFYMYKVEFYNPNKNKFQS